MAGVNIRISDQAFNMMTALLGDENFDPNDEKSLRKVQKRCEELCGLIDGIHKDNSELNPAQLTVKAANEHALNVKEAMFLSYIMGTEVGEQKAEAMQVARDFVQSLHQRFSRRTESSPFVFGAHMN